MAATKRNAMNIAEAREKIRVTQLVNRLQNHALGKLKKLEPSQLRAIEILLRKRLPDLAAITVEGGDPTNPVQFIMSNRPPKEER